jgi:hypothetical protein
VTGSEELHALSARHDLHQLVRGADLVNMDDEALEGSGDGTYHTHSALAGLLRELLAQSRDQIDRFCLRRGRERLIRCCDDGFGEVLQRSRNVLQAWP